MRWWRRCAACSAADPITGGVLYIQLLFTIYPLLQTPMRSATLHRQTNETDIQLSLNLDGTGQHDLATGIGSAGRPRQRASRPLLWLLAILAADIGLVIFLRGRGSSPQTAGLAPATTPTATEAVAAAPSTPVASPAQTAAPAPSSTPLPERARATRAAAAPTRAPVRSTAPPGVASAPPARAVPSTRQSWLDRAERDRRRAGADRKAQFTIQLELACEIPSLVDAWKHDRPAGTMWVLTTPYNGQTCFRVLWGRYPTREAARRALSGVPRFFSTPRNHPVVTAIR